MDTDTTVVKSSLSLERLSYLIIVVTVVLIPFFFVPLRYFPYQLGKGLLISSAILASFIIYLISLIKSGKISIPKNLFFLSVFLLPIVALLSAIVNSKLDSGFLGFSFQVETVSFLILGAVLIYLLSELFSSRERSFYAYVGFFLSFALVSLFELVRIVGGPETLSFGLFINSASNLIGNWNDLGVFFGAGAILSLMSLDMLNLSKRFKLISYIVFIVSLVFLVIVNFSVAWILLAVFCVIYFLYLLFSGNLQENQTLEVVSQRRKISYGAVVLFSLSLIFILWGTPIGTKVADFVNISSVEVRPSWSSTFEVIKTTVKESPLLGTGPSTFATQWLKFKPKGINETLFWDTDFTSGIGHLPTFIVSTGLVGLASWLLLIIAILLSGFRIIFKRFSDSISRYLAVSAFFLSLFFWSMATLYIPTITMFIFAFFFTGLFAASLYREGALNKKEIVFANHPKASFVAIILLIVLAIASVSLLFGIYKKSLSLVYFQKSVLGYQSNLNSSQAEERVQKALSLWNSDVYYRSLSELNLIELNSILNNQNIAPEQARDEFQKTLSKAIENAKRAVDLNPENYQNWLSLARVYSSVVPPPLAIQGAYENAKGSYQEALSRNPHSPAILLFLARLEAMQGNLKGAREFDNRAIAEKPNFAEGHFLLAQIEATEGNLAKAIPSLETTILLTPSNPGLFFQLGLLKYNERDYDGAINAFENAVQLVPDYANAKYFLGLSLWQIGKKEEAKRQFEDIEKTNPDNQELKLIISNLRAGKEPFAGAKPPVTNRPEKRDKLPIEQNN